MKHSTVATLFALALGSAVATPAAAQTPSVRDLIEQNGLLGQFGQSCDQAPSHANRYDIVRAVDAGHVQLDTMIGPSNRVSAVTIDKVEKLTAETIAVSGVEAQKGSRIRVVLRVEPGRLHLIEASNDKGEVFIKDARYPRTGRPVPWEAKCEPGVPRTWLGIQAEALPDNQAGRFGVVAPNAALAIDYIFPKSPAGNADLRAGDIITKFDGSNLTDVSDFATRTAVMQPGRSVTLNVLRNGKNLVVQLPVVPRPPQETLNRPVSEVLRSHGLLGIFAQNCRAEPSPTNQWLVLRAIDAGRVQLDAMQARNAILWTNIVYAAHETWPNSILLASSQPDGQKLGYYVYSLDGNRIRQTAVVAADGRVLAENGRNKADGKELSWLSKCE